MSNHQVDIALVVVLTWCAIMFVIVMVRFVYSWYKNIGRQHEINGENQHPTVERNSSLPRDGSSNSRSFSLENDVLPSYQELMKTEKKTEKFDFPIEV